MDQYSRNRETRSLSHAAKNKRRAEAANSLKELERLFSRPEQNEAAAPCRVQAARGLNIINYGSNSISKEGV
jgi:hypothetical protein